MIVEDETLIVMLLEDMLLDLGYEVAASVQALEEAIVTARSLAIDIAVLDVNLAGAVSFPVADILRDRGIPFVFATGYGAGALANRFAGVPVVTKPFASAQLAQAFRTAELTVRAAAAP
jgi:CheY-like chemotaxis protein